MSKSSIQRDLRTLFSMYKIKAVVPMKSNDVSYNSYAKSGRRACRVKLNIRNKHFDLLITYQNHQRQFCFRYFINLKVIPKVKLSHRTKLKYLTFNYFLWLNCRNDQLF